jgi:hypothetical protein
MYFKKQTFQNGLYVLILLMIVVNIFTLFLFVSNFNKGDLSFDFEGLRSGWGNKPVVFDPGVTSLRFRVSLVLEVNEIAK